MERKRDSKTGWDCFSIKFQLQIIISTLISYVTWSKLLILTTELEIKRMLLSKQKFPECQQNVQIIYFTLMCFLKLFKSRALLCSRFKELMKYILIDSYHKSLVSNYTWRNIYLSWSVSPEAIIFPLKKKKMSSA